MASALLLVIPLVIIVGIGIRLAAGGMDRDRVQGYFSSRGFAVQTLRWRPFGRGWFGERGERIYDVTYRDSEGGLHAATLKTSLFSGVYLTDDRILKASSSPPRPTASEPPPPTLTENELLRQENARLRREVDDLSRKRGP